MMPATRIRLPIAGSFYHELREDGGCGKLIGVTWTSRFVPYAALAAVGVAACGPTSSYNVATERQETLFIDTAKEIALGESVARKVEEEFTVIRDPELLKQLDRVSSRIVAVADRKDLSYRFTIVQMKEAGEDQPNAFALPGGPVYVTRALFDLVKSDDELAAVVSHEVGHIVAKHVVKRIQGAVGMQILQVLAGVSRAGGEARESLDLAFASILTEYSQSDELQADRLGLRYMKRAGYDQAAAIRFMERLRAHNLKQPLRRYSYFRTHPYFADRIRLLRQQSEGKITFDDYINKRE